MSSIRLLQHQSPEARRRHILADEEALPCTLPFPYPHIVAEEAPVAVRAS